MFEAMWMYQSTWSVELMPQNYTPAHYTPAHYTPAIQPWQHCEFHWEGVLQDLNYAVAPPQIEWYEEPLPLAETDAVVASWMGKFVAGVLVVLAALISARAMPYHPAIYV